MSVEDRTAWVARAKQAMAHLSSHPDTTRSQLGAARDQFNIVNNFNDSWAVADAVFALETMVVQVYGDIPQTNPAD